MAVSKALLKFRKLVTSSKLPRAFTDEIRSQSDLFLSKPIGTSADFSEAFHSRKTNPAVRYAMVVSGILGEQDVLNRSLSNLNKKLHFKIEPQYSKKGGRLRLSHFKVKGFDSSGHGQYLRIDNISKQMMMGTPVDAPRARYATTAISGSRNTRKLTYRQVLDKVAAELKGIKKPDIDLDKLSKGIKRMQAFKRIIPKTVSPELLKKIIRNVEKKEALSMISRLGNIEKEAMLLMSDEQLQAYVRSITVTGNELEDAEDWEEAKQAYERYLDVQNQMPQVNKMYAASKLGWHPSQPLVDTWVPPKKPRKPRAKPTTRKLRARERARVNRAMNEILKHLQGIMWVLHSTIKLNDKRRQFMYIDEGYIWTPENSDPVMLNLFGFPQHIKHYIEQHKRFMEWFVVFKVGAEAEDLKEKMNSALRVAEDIDGDFFGDEEDMQDFVDELLGLCSAALRSTAWLYDKITNTDWIFTEPVPYEFKLPSHIPKFMRHPTTSKAFRPSTDREAVSLKVSRYKELHSDYWDKLKND